MKKRKEVEKNVKIAVGGLVFFEGKLLLCRSPKWDGKWLIPGGGMKWGETIAQTLQREIKEETGLDVDFVRIGETKTVTEPPEFNKKGMHFLMIDCECVANSRDVALNEEHDAYDWVLPEDALKMDMLKYSREAIEAYLKREKERDYLAGWKRCQADFENYRRQTELKIPEAALRGRENVIIEVLPVLDNFNLATAHVPEDEKEAGWVVGIMHIKRQLEELLRQQGVSEILAEGSSFDPTYHESVGEIKGDKSQKGRIAEVVQRGYMMGDRVIRPAKVKIGI